MTYDLKSFSSVSQSYQDDGRPDDYERLCAMDPVYDGRPGDYERLCAMDPAYDWKDLRFTRGSNAGPLDM